MPLARPIPLRLAPAQLAWLDRCRGDTIPRSAAIRVLIDQSIRLHPFGILPATSTPETLAHLDRLCSDVVDLARERKVEEIVLVADAFRQPTIADVIDRLRGLHIVVQV